MGAYKEPHGGELKDLYLNETEAEQEKQRGRDYKSWDLTDRQVCDIELLLNGAFSPLEGFLTEAEYDGVVKDLHLPNGILWPMPIFLAFLDRKRDKECKEDRNLLFQAQ